MSWQDEVNLFLANGNESHSENVVEVYEGGDIQLLDLVQILEPGLAGTDATQDIRLRSMELLSAVLKASVQYTRDQLKFLVPFLTSQTRLSDPMTTQPTIEAALSLVQNQNHFSGFEVDVAKSIFEHIHIQSSTQPIRHTVFVLMLTLANKFHATLKQHFGTGFATNIVKQVDGEKDPRCLLQAFSLVASVVKHFPIEGSVEDLFDITSCYFPITFTPPPNDEFGITQQDLISGLNQCLTSSSIFATLCFELIFEKLGSGVDEVKLQSYQLMCDCAVAFGAHPIAPFLSHAYTAIRSELFQSFDKKLEAKGLESLSTLVKTLSGVTANKNTKSKTDLHTFLDPMIVEAVRALSDFDVGLVNVSTRLLTAAAKASDSAASLLLTTYGKAVLSKYNTDVSDDQRVAYIRSLSDLLVAATESSPYGEDNATATVRSGVVMLVTDACRRQPAVHAAGLKCLASLVSTGTLTADDMSPFAEEVTSVIMNHGDSRVRDRAQEVCVMVTKHYVDIAVTVIVPKLSEALQVGVTVQSSINETTVVHTLQAVAIDQKTAVMVIKAFYTRLVALCSGKSDQSAMECIAVAINQIVSEGIIPTEHLVSTVIDPCFSLYFSNLSGEGASVLLHSAILNTFAKVVRTACQACDTAQQEGIINTTLEKFGSSKFASDHLLVRLMSAVVCSMTRDLAGTSVSIDHAERMLRFATNCSTTEGANDAAMAAASVYNKITDDALLASTMDKAIAFISSQDMAVSLVCGAWLAKALVMRGHKSADALTSTLLTALSHPQHGEIAADGYRIIMADHEGGLCPELFGMQTFMFKQRFFATTLPSLVAGFKSAHLAQKPNYLLALSHILGAVPKQVLLSEVTTVWPLLMETLSQSEQALSSSTLILMKILIDEAQDVIAEHTESLIKAMLKLCRSPQPMKVRMDALECLESIAALPSQKVFPHVNSTVRALIPILDDPKRLVRRKAVCCRTVWIALAQ